MLNQRASGVLCHISSLPSSFGIGDLGPEAYRFVDFLANSGQKYWQVLPLNPTDRALANSPYSSCSAFAFNTLLMSPEGLLEDGFLVPKDLEPLRVPDGDVDYSAVTALKSGIIAKAWSTYRGRRVKLQAFENFCREQKSWLNDYALFMTLKRRFGHVCWTEWPVELRDRDPRALAGLLATNAEDIEEEKFAQFLCFRQWTNLQDYCSRKGVSLVGDMPIYVNYDSVDVWVAPGFFKLDGSKRPTFVAGVPPDYFSEDGQRWGNPVYDWEALKRTGFAWWIERMRHNLALFDAVRVDHFRAFAQCWEIPASEKTAKNGAWCDVPGAELFSILKAHFPRLPIIAEDLGIITKDVDALKDLFGFPGMHVLMFAFHNDYKKSRDLPENFKQRGVVYTGTHDNNTVRGWYQEDITAIEKKNMLEYFGREIALDEIHWVLIDEALASRANLAIVPLQDLLGLGGGARMNKPSTIKNNWKWRLLPGQLTRSVSNKLKRLTIANGR